MLEPVTGLGVASQQGSLFHFSWTNPDLSQVDLQFFDVAIDPGFLYFISQQPVLGQTSASVTLTNNPGKYYVRVNTHYIALGVRGWAPSNIVQVDIVGELPPAMGTPASGVMLNQNTLSWNPGSGNISRVSVDISASENFDDILSAPFVPPIVSDPPIAGLALIIDALPIACDMPITVNSLILDPLPPEPFFIRVNTLFEMRTWIASETLAEGSKFNWLVVAGITIGVALIPLIIKGKL